MRKEYEIDLSENNLLRFVDMEDGPDMVNVSEMLIDSFKKSSGGFFKTPLLKILSKFNFFNIPNKYRKEIKYWQMITDIDEWLYIANAAYEVFSAAANLQDINFSWCTSCVKYTTMHGMIHMRNMDWPLERLEEGTVILNYKNALAGDFKTITWPGFSGVISGVAKGRFSASINMNAIDNSFDVGGKPVAFILRDAFEKCRTCKNALDYISNQRVMAPAFVHLAGIKKSEHYVIDLNPNQTHIWYPHEFHMDPFAIANHDLDDKSYEDEYYEMDSEERRKFIVKKAKSVHSPKTALSVLKKPPVMNEETKQSMVLLPKTGQILLNEV